MIIILGGVGIAYLFTSREAGQNKSIAALNKKKDSISANATETINSDSVTKIIAADNAKSESRVMKAPSVAEAQKSFKDSEFIYRSPTANKKEAPSVAGGGYLDNRLKRSADLTTRNAVVTARQNESEQNEIKAGLPGNHDREPAAMDLKKNAVPVIKKFIAQVVDKDGTPLPFSNINIVDQHIGTYADVKGNFRLISADSVLNIEIKSVGYATRNFTLKSDVPQNKIVLSEDESALKEKIVVSAKVPEAKSKKSSSAFLQPDSLIDVEPEDGWNNYDTYLTNNLSLPDDPLQQNIHGEVEVSFQVQPNGSISNMKIDRSLCNDCDKAALRAIKEGPRWKVKKGGQGTAKVKVKF